METKASSLKTSPTLATADGVNTGATSRVPGDDILVVIPALNEASHIETCVRSLMAGETRLKGALFIVVDGGSTDKTREIVERLTGEFPNLLLLHNPMRLQSAAVNLAAKTFGVGRRILVRCDAHSIYTSGYVRQVADSLDRFGVSSVVVPMDAIGQSCFQKANAWIVDTPLGSGGSSHRGGRTSGFVDHGHHAGFDLRTFLHVGGYDETFSHNEDAEFDRRLAKAGGRIYLDTSIRITYVPRDTVRSLAKQYFNYGKGRARTLLKHDEYPKLRQFIPPFTLIASLTGLLAAPFNPWTLILPGGYLAVLVLASLAVAFARRSFCGLLAGLASATMHMSWSAGMLLQVLRGQGRRG